MFRAIYPQLLLALVSVGMFGGQLTAHEPVQEPKSQSAESNVSFERRQFTVGRNKGKILFNGFVAPRQILENMGKEVRLIETFDGLQFASNKDFIQWTHKLKGTRTYTYDEVKRVSADGTTITQPLVFFSETERNELDPKWQAWLDERQAELEKSNRIRLAQEQEAKRYQQLKNLHELQTQVLSAQAAAAERSAESLAVISGETSLWEVELFPSNTGFSGSFYDSHSKSIYVRAFGRTSQDASDHALNSNLGYQVGSIRKLAGY